MVTFISGGARSGKSTFAENHALQIFQGLINKKDHSLLYLATAERTDHEMIQRISRHIEERDSVWHTIEAPLEITNVLNGLKGQEVILLDCLTVWLNNMMYKGKADLPMIMSEVSKWIQLSNQKQLKLIVVSNDVNEDIPSNNFFINQYIYHLEKIHHLMTSKADCVYQVVAGIPIKWKG